MTFSVNIPSTDLVKETDYCGLVSGSKTDKVKDTHFKVFYGSINSAPLIEQCPVNHACEVVQILDLGSHELIIGRIKETHISEDCLKDGRPDVIKIKPFSMTLGKYTAVGETVGDTFRSGSAISPDKAAEGIEQMKKMRPPR
jgi:flavin reductase (DIM6/NTAB) family NADH-FMN oxidoreductase RutF